MKIAIVTFFIIFLVVSHACATDTISKPKHAIATTQSHSGWELVRSASDSPTDFFVLIPKGKERDIPNYLAAASEIAGTTDRCSIYFWVDRTYIPTSTWIPTKNLRAMTATYERFPSYKEPVLRLACWLYENKEAGEREKCFYMPGAVMPWEKLNDTTTPKE